MNIYQICGCVIHMHVSITESSQSKINHISTKLAYALSLSSLDVNFDSNLSFNWHLRFFLKLVSDFDKILPKELKIFQIIKSILSFQNELVQHFIQDFCFVCVLASPSSLSTFLSVGKFIKIALLSTLWGLILGWI